jgi:choline dehydrogenase-like flavoprotein
VGLRVIDASNMPDCPRVNVDATTMMLADKIATTTFGAPLVEQAQLSRA